MSMEPPDHSIFVTNGRPVRVGTARWQDADKVRAFVAGLSVHSQVMRFFTSLPRPPDSMVRTMVTVDEHRDALVALHDGEVVGHAMSFHCTPTHVELAVVVADAWQGMGLGTHLIKSLVQRAAAVGATTVGMDVLGENRKVLAMAGRLWPHARMQIESGTVKITAQMPDCSLRCGWVA